jgi:hypothetical protein
MERYRVTASNGREWVTESLQHRDAIAALTSGEDVLEFAGTPVAEGAVGPVRVAISCRQLVSVEEWPD